MEQFMKQMLSEMKEMRREMRTDITEIKTRITEMKADQELMKSQLDENTQLTRAIFDRQEETDAKLENLTLYVHKSQEDVASIKRDVTDLKSEVAFTYEKTLQNELEIFKLRRNKAD